MPPDLGFDNSDAVCCGNKNIGSILIVPCFERDGAWKTIKSKKVAKPVGFQSNEIADHCCQAGFPETRTEGP